MGVQRLAGKEGGSLINNQGHKPPGARVWGVSIGVVWEGEAMYAVSCQLLLLLY